MHRLEESTAEIDVFEALLERTDRELGLPWGFEVTGGVRGGVDTPITITRITPGSSAARIGLKSGDHVTEIGDKATDRLSLAEACALIEQYGLTLILTVERRARGAPPINPVVSHQAQPPQLKTYQTYDMSGGTPHPRHPPQYQSFQTVHSSPYVEPMTRSMPAPVHSTVTSHPTQRSDHYGPPQPPPPPPPQYTPYYQEEEDDPAEGAASQSRTFKMLQSLMENQGEVPKGVLGDSTGGAVNTPHVKAIVNAQYNSPIYMYTPENIADSVDNKLDDAKEAERKREEAESDPKNFVTAETLRLVQEMDAEEKGLKTPVKRGFRN